MGTSRAILTLALVAGLSACAITEPPPVEVYTASEKYPDEHAAEEAWLRIFQDQPIFADGMNPRGAYLGKERFVIIRLELQLRRKGFPEDYLAIERYGGKTESIRLRDLPDPIRVLQIRPGSYIKYIVVISNDLAIVPDRVSMAIGGNPAFSKQTAENMADILSTLRDSANGWIISDSQWRQVVSDYSGRNRPPITEEMRRYAVEAESFIKQKRFSDASRSYGEALRRWPWWSQARYMRALVLGELKRYTYAAKEMTRYLELEPDSPDYRRLKDQVYEWESYARR